MIGHNCTRLKAQQPPSDQTKIPQDVVAPPQKKKHTKIVQKWQAIGDQAKDAKHELHHQVKEMSDSVLEKTTTLGISQDIVVPTDAQADELIFGTTEWQSAKGKGTMKEIRHDLSTPVGNKFSQLPISEAVMAHTSPLDKGGGGLPITV